MFKECLKNVCEKLNLSEIDDISHVNQNGDYAVFIGANRKSANTYEAKINVILARNSLDHARNLAELDAIEAKVFEMEAMRGTKIGANISVHTISESLYAYVFNLEIQIKRVD